VFFTDPYTDPETGVFFNKLGIRNAAALQRAEYKYTSGRANQLMLHPIIGQFDMAHLCAIHQYLFQDLYEWAGKLHTITILKGN